MSEESARELGEAYWKRIADENTALRAEVKRLRLGVDDEARARLRKLADMADDPAFPLLDVVERLEKKVGLMKATLATVHRLVGAFAVETPAEHVHAPAYDFHHKGLDTLSTKPNNFPLFADSEKGGGRVLSAPVAPERPVERSDADYTGPSGPLGEPKP